MNTEIKAVAFDVDGTLISSSVWHALHELFGLSRDDNRKEQERYVRGDISFRERMQSLDRAFLAASPLPHKGEVSGVLADFQFLDGAAETVAALSARPLAVISSGFREYVAPVARALSIPHAYSYIHLHFHEDGAYGGMRFPIDEDELRAKVDALLDFGKKTGAAPHEIAFVGDSSNDLEAFKHTGRGILVGEGTPELRAAAWRQVGAISDILAIL